MPEPIAPKKSALTESKPMHKPPKAAACERRENKGEARYDENGLTKAKKKSICPGGVREAKKKGTNQTDNASAPLAQ